MTATELMTLRANCEATIAQIDKIVELQRDLTLLPYSPYYQIIAKNWELEADILEKQKLIYQEETVLMGMMK